MNQYAPSAPPLDELYYSEPSNYQNVYTPYKLVPVNNNQNFVYQKPIYTKSSNIVIQHPNLNQHPNLIQHPSVIQYPVQQNYLYNPPPKLVQNVNKPINKVKPKKKSFQNCCIL